MNTIKTRKKKPESNLMTASHEPTVTEAEPSAPAPLAAPRLRLDESNAKLSYANFFNVSSTREETALMFGMVQVSANPRDEVAIQVSDRVVITPHAAKRLQTMLGQVLDQYETRFGPLRDQASGR
jgi:hypothetical protein